MPSSLTSLMTRIASGKVPEVILVGGNSEYLADRAFQQLRDAISARPGVSLEAYEPGAALSSILDSYRTMSLFGGARLIVVPEVNAFVQAKELGSLFEKALTEWRTAKTDRKRGTAAAKLLHVLGLVGADLEMSDEAIARTLGTPMSPQLADMLAFCRTTGKKPTRGEDDASLLTETVARGGASGTTLLMKTAEIPADSATVDLIDRKGAVIVADLSRESFNHVLEDAIAQIADEQGVSFDSRSIARLRQRLGIERILADKFSKELPDLRATLAEVERLCTLAGKGGRVTPAMIEAELEQNEGGARYELGSLFSEGKYLEAVAKLRSLVAQGRRDDPRSAIDIQYGKFLFPLADELRQMIGIHSYAKSQGISLSKSITYNRFKDTVADRLGDYLKSHGLVKQKPHPFPLHKKWEAARTTNQRELFQQLAALAEMDVRRKSGGLPTQVALELFLLNRVRT